MQMIKRFNNWPDEALRRMAVTIKKDRLEKERIVKLNSLPKRTILRKKSP